MTTRPSIEPLKRAQRLAKEAVNAPTNTAAFHLTRQAFDAARECANPYQAATAATWPLKVLRIKGHDRALAVHTAEILGVLGDVNCVSRLWLLLYVIGALCGGPSDLFFSVVRRFIAEASMCRSWRTPRLIPGVLLAAEIVDSRLADDVLNLYETPRAKERAARALAEMRATPPTVGDCDWPNLR
jgi:hypothetical protein